jgi:hypothetical protein
MKKEIGKLIWDGKRKHTSRKFLARNKKPGIITINNNFTLEEALLEIKQLKERINEEQQEDLKRCLTQDLSTKIKAYSDYFKINLY